MLNNRDLVAALHCVGELIRCTDHEKFVAALIRIMHPLMDANVTGYNEADPLRGRFAFVLHPRETVTDETIAIWVKHAQENPVLVNMQKNPTDTAVYKITDFVTQKEFRKTALCQKLYQPMRGEYQMVLPFLMAGSAAIAVVFNRDRDFTERDREILTLLQPLITTAYRNVQKMTELQFTQDELQAAVDNNRSIAHAAMEDLGLSRRQGEVLHQLLQGHSNKQIATHLKLSIRTVEKYVEQLLKKLKVPTRAAVMAKFQNGVPHLGGRNQFPPG
jgi:DNA-binding CsgD family transcriptional regulator